MLAGLGIIVRCICKKYLVNSNRYPVISACVHTERIHRKYSVFVVCVEFDQSFFHSSSDIQLPFLRFALITDYRLLNTFLSRPVDSNNQQVTTTSTGSPEYLPIQKDTQSQPEYYQAMIQIRLRSGFRCHFQSPIPLQKVRCSH